MLIFYDNVTLLIMLIKCHYEKKGYYQMSQKQLGRYVTISKLREKQLAVKEAATSLGSLVDKSFFSSKE